MKCRLLLALCMCLFFVACSKKEPAPTIVPPNVPADASVLELYPGAGYESDLYMVEVWDGEAWQPSFTYCVAEESITPWKTGRLVDVHFTTFGTSEARQVRVTLLDGMDIFRATISPAAKGYTYEAAGAQMTVTVVPGDKMWLEINAADGPLLLFADAPKPAIPEGATVFGPGFHDIGFQYRPAEGDTLYFDGGAWVTGSIDIRGLNNVKIIGPGVLSGEKSAYDNLHAQPFEVSREHCMILGDYNASTVGCLLQGVTIVNAPFYHTFGGLHEMRGVKLISPWHYSTDGFYVMPDAVNHKGLVEDCFAFIGDDVFFPRDSFMGDLTYRNCFVTTTSNGVFNLAYWPLDMQHDYQMLAEDIYIKPINGNAVFQCVLDGSAADAGKGIKNHTYRNIYLEGYMGGSLIHIENRPYPWGGLPDSPCLGRTENMRFENITLDLVPSQKSRIWGRDAENNHTGYTFENITIGGVKLTEENFTQFFEINEFFSEYTVR